MAALLLLSTATQAQQVPNPAPMDVVVGWVGNNAALKARAYKTGPVYRAGFAAPGDGGGATYTHSTAACTLNGGTGDDGSQVKDNAAGCWNIHADAHGVDFRVWGAAGGQNVDDQLDAAINFACTTHIPIKFQLLKANEGDNYRLTRAHTIGDGSATQNSNCNGVSFIADVHYPEYAQAQGTMFQWYGPPGVVPITVRGPMVSVKMLGLSIDCRSICSTGFVVINAVDSEFGWMGVRRNTNGPAFIFTSEPTNIWFGGFEQTWVHDIMVGLPGAGGSGVVVGDSSCPTAPACYVSVISSRFDHLAALYDGQTAGTFGLKLGFATNVTFNGGRFDKLDNLGTLGNSLVIAPPPGAPGYPTDIAFYHSHFNGPVSVPEGWAPQFGKIKFDGWFTGYTPFPHSPWRHGDFWGTDMDGNYYPSPTAWTLTDASGAGLTPTATDTLWYKVGKSCTVSFNVTYPANSNGNVALLGTIPTPCMPHAVTGGVAVAGGAPAYTDMATPVIVAFSTDGKIGFYNNIGAAYSNASLSGKRIAAQFSWIAN